MIIKIKYEDPNQHGEFLIEEIDDTLTNVPEYCINLHKTKLCNTRECDGEHCKIWMEINGEFMLIGVMD
jgi:hypothetical protein